MVLELRRKLFAIKRGRSLLAATNDLSRVGSLKNGNTLDGFRDLMTFSKCLVRKEDGSNYFRRAADFPNLCLLMLRRV